MNNYGKKLNIKTYKKKNNKYNNYKKKYKINITTIYNNNKYNNYNKKQIFIITIK